MSLKLPVIRDHHAVYILGHLVHHWVRPPGGSADQQPLALLFGVAVSRFGLSWGWAGDAFNATKRINTFLSCTMQLLVLVLAGLVFGFA